MEYFDDPQWIEKNFGGKIPESEKLKEYNIADDMKHCNKILEHVLKMAPEYLEEEIKKFKKIQSKLKYGNDLTVEDREFFKLFHETLDNLYSNIGQIINHVYSVSIGKNN